MKIEELILIIDELYNRLHIPCGIMDEQLRLLHPKNTMVDIHDFLQGVLFISPDKLKILVVDQRDAYACFTFTLHGDLYYIISCCLIKNIKSDEDKIPKRWRNILPQGIDFHSYIASEHLTNYVNFMKMMYTIVRGQQPTPAQITIEQVTEVAKVSRQEELKDSLTMRRITQSTPDYYRWEQRFFESFRKGDFQKITSLLAKLNNDNTIPLSSDRLQERKYKFVGFLTLLTRITIQEGVSGELAFSLSDSYMQQVENIRSYEDVMTIIKQAIYDFYDLMSKGKRTQYSLNILKCLHFIDTHLYERISLQDLCTLTSLSSSYLSSAFKKEMQETISSYIQRKKIEEATRLLLFTDKSFIEISSLLQFSSQSAFIQVFKKVQGMTPKQYQLLHTKDI